MTTYKKYIKGYKQHTKNTSKHMINRYERYETNPVNEAKTWKSHSESFSVFNAWGGKSDIEEFGRRNFGAKGLQKLRVQPRSHRGKTESFFPKLANFRRMKFLKWNILRPWLKSWKATHGRNEEHRSCVSKNLRNREFWNKSTTESCNLSFQNDIITLFLWLPWPDWHGFWWEPWVL